MTPPIPDDKIVLGIDPGNVQSAYCYLQGNKILSFDKAPNDDLTAMLVVGDRYDFIACEMIGSYGMPAGASLFDTCVQIGRIKQMAHVQQIPFTLLLRIQVKSHICHDGRAKDANIRQALIDLFGPQGTKKAPGPTYGISADCWAALAVAETFRSGDYTPYILSQDKPQTP